MHEETVTYTEKMGDAVTADHKKVLNEENESRLQHRHAHVVQGLLFLLDPKSPNEKQNCSRDDGKFARVGAARSEARYY